MVVSTLQDWSNHVIVSLSHDSGHEEISLWFSDPPPTLSCIDLPSPLQTLWYHCQKPLDSLRLVASLAGEAAARKLRGAALLNLLHQKSGFAIGTSRLLRSLQWCSERSYINWQRMIHVLYSLPCTDHQVECKVKFSLLKGEASSVWGFCPTSFADNYCTVHGNRIRIKTNENTH